LSRPDPTPLAVKLYFRKQRGQIQQDEQAAKGQEQSGNHLRWSGKWAAT
jgi:hypothetical protein